MLSKEILDNLKEYLAQNINDTIVYKECPEINLSNNRITENEDTVILNTIISHSSYETIDAMKKSLEHNSEVLTVFTNKVKMIRNNPKKDLFECIDEDEYIDQVGASLDMNSVDTTFYEVLVLYILEAGYRKVSDFYNKIGIDKRVWARYKHGLIPTDQVLYEIFIYLQIEFVEIQFLMNLAGKVFRKNDPVSMIVRYFLKEQYQLKTEPEALMIMIDTALTNFGYKVLFSVE